MPDGSSSDAPVTRPGPMTRRYWPNPLCVRPFARASPRVPCVLATDLRCPRASRSKPFAALRARRPDSDPVRVSGRAEVGIVSVTASAAVKEEEGRPHAHAQRFDWGLLSMGCQRKEVALYGE